MCVIIGGSDIAGLKDEYLTGDFDFDPLKLAPKNNQDKFLEQRSKELNNGRLAMIAWCVPPSYSRQCH